GCADGRARNGPGRRGPRARMDGTRAQRAARSGLDRGRVRLRSLAADLAGERAARRLRVEGSARRRGPWHRDRAPRRRAGASYARGSCHARDRATSAAPSACERGEGESAASGRGGRSTRPFLRWWSKRAPRNGGRDGRGVARAGEMTAVGRGVTPLGHAPDDPGPNGETEAEPAPEPATPPSDGWSRIRALFRP